MFYSTADNHNINNFYLNYLDVLKKFKRYFTQRAEKIIQEAERTKDSFTHHPMLKQSGQYAVKDIFATIAAELLQKLNIHALELDWNTIFRISSSQLDQLLTNRSYPIKCNNGVTTLSKMEIKTLIELIKGKHAGEIADSLTIRQSTVESYLFNIKNKLGVNLKSELIHHLVNNQLLQKIELC